MMSPKIACIGVIEKLDNPLHISLFPPYLQSSIDFSFLLNSCLDVIETRQKQTSIGQDLGLLHAVDERLAAYAWLTPTGVKYIVIVDVIGQVAPLNADKTKGAAVIGLKEADLKQVFKALQSAYIRLLQNPFYSPKEHSASSSPSLMAPEDFQITNKRFIEDVRRIGSSWTPGLHVGQG